MAKSFVRISLASKLRVLFASAVLAIIAAALVMPWYFMELLAEQGLQRPAAEITRLRLNEWLRYHSDKNSELVQRAYGKSEVTALYASDSQTTGRKGPQFIVLDHNKKPKAPSLDPNAGSITLDPLARQALGAFRHNAGLDSDGPKPEEQAGKTVYRYFMAVRADATCMSCHKENPKPGLRFQQGELVAFIDLTLPEGAASTPLVLWTRLAFILGGALAALVAVIVFAVITQRLILRPIRKLRDIADKVTDGDLAVRSSIRTGDELQRLGDSFNEMLAAIADQQDKLRAANHALDLKLNELAQSNVTLGEANRVKSEFVANVSHELRTPLNSIIGFAELLTETPDERLRRYSQNILSAAKNLLNMINDILDLAKIEAGKAVVRFDKVSVSDTCQTLLTLMKPQADKKQMELKEDLADNVPIIVTDGGKLQQILYNLLSNAIKFTPVGGQAAIITRMETAQRAGTVVEEVSISVSDTGPGIAEADQQRIFEKFYQTDRTLTREVSGTGLGLSISKELAALLGGRLTLKSAPGEGATFTLTLPVNPPQAAEQQNAPAREKTE